MIDIKQHMLRLQFKEVVKLFDQNYTAAWKTSENSCIDENLFFFCILRYEDDKYDDYQTGIFTLYSLYIIGLKIYHCCFGDLLCRPVTKN